MNIGLIIDYVNRRRSCSEYVRNHGFQENKAIKVLKLLYNFLAADISGQSVTTAVSTVRTVS